jgi:diguanylate cyclase (GGDEF)-like protein/PAS domain S-box-containing protein
VNLSYAVWLTVSGAIALLVAGLGWRRRAAPGARALTLLMMSLAVWSLTYAIYWLSGPAEVRAVWLKMTFFGVVIAPVAFFVLVLQFVDLDSWLTKGAYAWIMVVPVLSLFFLWTDPLHGLFFGEYRPLGESLVVRGGPWFYVMLIYSYGLMSSGIVLLIRVHLRASAFYKRQTIIVLAGAMLPWLVNFLVLTGWAPLPGLDLTPIAFTGTGLLFAYGFFGYRMMDLTPVGRDVLVENMDDAIVVVDTNSRIVDINPTAKEFADPGLELPFGRLFIDVFSRWADIIPNYVALEGRAELKLERPPFSFFELKIISLKDRQGHVVGKLITWRDITARKQVEEQLRIFFHAVEQNPAAIVITDPNGGIEYVNPHFTRLTGYTLNEMRGKTPRILKSGETSDDTYKTLWQTIKAGQVWEGEVLNRKKNEELYWVNELIAPVLDENGVATHFVAMQQDITERKHTESELRVINTRLQVQLMEIENLHDQLREEAIRDGLTRLFNRRYMEETLDREISRAERGSFPIGVVMMDVDLFKSINDSYGHQAGDAVLQTLGTMLLENTRISDIACRFGGDEMLVVMPGATQDVAVARAEEWRVAFSMMEFTFGEERIRTTLSLGVASFPDQARNPIELLTAADKALYWAKIGRNNVCRYEPGMMARSLNRSDDIR